ncbi:MAG: glycosyltransferase family 9 protein [Bacteroidota bacterium]
MSIPKHILVIRLSAPGDVAMTVPVLHSFQKVYPSVRLTILTSKRLAPLFSGLTANLFFAETKTEHKGFAGLFKLFKQLNEANKNDPFDAVADLHNVLRSQIIRSLYKVKGIKTASIDKGRAEKKALTRKENKLLKQLPTSFDRYRDVFHELGFDFTYDFISIFSKPVFLSQKIISLTGEKKDTWIGIAPFAAYKEKMYPLEKMEEAVTHLLLQPGVKIIFFGSAAESIILVEWEKKYKGIINAAGKLDLAEELVLISHLDVMISMDSANMHFASLVNVPVISIWGPTHPFAGFMGWNQSADNAVQTELYCRPCSVFGNKPCYRGDHACMNMLTPVSISDKVKKLLQQD